MRLFYSLLAVMIACGAAVLAGKSDASVGLDSALQLWADVVRDADEFGLQATRVSAAKEMQLGAELAGQRWGQEDPGAQKYVAAVGEGLVRSVNRRGIHYQFHVIVSPQINAFALPGGQIFVLSGMLDFLESEAELAAILGHEIAHVDLRHCIARYQYSLALKQVGAGSAGGIVDLAHALVAAGYSQYQELEADASGEGLAIESGYDPDAAAAVFQRLQSKMAGDGRAPRATTPAGEITQSVGEAIGSYFRSHPPSEERTRQLTEMVTRNRRRLAGRIVYKGVTNYRQRIARSEVEFPAEQRLY